MGFYRSEKSRGSKFSRRSFQTEEKPLGKFPGEVKTIKLSIALSIWKKGQRDRCKFFS